MLLFSISPSENQPRFSHRAAYSNYLLQAANSQSAYRLGVSRATPRRQPTWDISPTERLTRQRTGRGLPVATDPTVDHCELTCYSACPEVFHPFLSY